MTANRFKGKRICAACAALAFGGVLLSSSVVADTQYVYADVIESRPIYQAVTVAVPREQCWTEQVRVKSAGQSGSRTPVLISTIVGGAIGNALGNNKSSQRVGTVVGAALGHSVGRDIVNANRRDTPAHYQTVQHCETVSEYRDEERLTGYLVRYRYQGQEYSLQSDRDPGERIRLRVDIQPML